MSSKSFSFSIVILLAVLLLTPYLAVARGGGGGGGGRGGGFSGGGRSWGSSRSNSSSSNRSSSANRALYDRARTQGTAFRDRSSAVTSFRSRYGAQYTNHFSSEPSIRPSYIPQTTVVSGRNVTIIYNQEYGGYGYYSPTHAWIMYDLWADRMMINQMMMSQGYYYGDAPAYDYSAIWGLALFIIVFFLIIVSRRNRMRIKSLSLFVVVLLAVSLLTPSFVAARGGGGGGRGGGFSGGGGRSWGSSSSSTRTSSPGSSSFGGGQRSWGSGSSGSSSSGRSSAADSALYNRARSQGTTFSDRSSAVSNFRSRYGSQYTNRFSSEPSVRPTYIPQTTIVGGRSVTVIYNRSYGGYGYYSPLTNAWIMYDLWSDQMMMNRMMMNQGYYYGGPPTYYHTTSIWSVLLFLFVGLVGLIIIYAIIAWIIRLLSGNTVDVFDESETVIYTETTQPMMVSTPIYTQQPVAPPPPTFHSVHEFQGAPDDINQAAFWQDIPLGSVITLSDRQALDDSVREGRGNTPRDYSVIEIQTLEEAHGLASWKLYRIKEIAQELLLMAKLVGKEVDVRVYYPVPEEEFKPGNRRDMVESNRLWLFQQPDNPDHFIYDELRYTTQINGPEELGKPPVVFQMRDHGPMSGVLTTNPPQAIAGELFAIIVEYQAPENSTDNPELLLLEVGGIDLRNANNDSDKGGLITLYQGSAIPMSQVDVLKKHDKV